MKRLHFSIQIDAPVEKVWEIMLSDKTYRDWTATFMAGSHFVGSWEQDSKIQFLSADENGKLGGMTSQIVRNRPHEFISVKHLGIVADGVEDTTSGEAKKWVGYENYTFSKVAGGTELVIDVDTNDDFIEFMTEAWEKALARIKELAEG